MAMVAPAAQAQTQDSGSLEIPTITVTAQKRTEDVRQVPLNISVLSGAQLDEQHIVDFTDLSRAVPGLSFQNVGGAGLDKINLRGVSSDSSSPTVGIYLDEVPITMRNLLNSGATEPEFFDVDRIEVLRGPQGTLYGASSMGGTIRFISRQPNLENFGYGLYSELSGTDHGGLNFKENVVVNQPIIQDKLAIRLGAQYGELSGYIDHVNPDTGLVTDRGVNTEKTAVLKVTLKGQITDDLTVTPSVFLQRVRAGDTSVYDLGLPALEQQKRVVERSRDTLFIPSLTVDYDLGWSNLTAVSSYFYRQFNRVQDGTLYNNQYFSNILDNTPSLNPGYDGVNPATLSFDSTPVFNTPGPAFIYPTQQQYTQEIRLASKSTKESGSSFAWVGGVYVSTSRIRLDDQEYAPGISNTLQSIYGQSAVNVAQQTFNSNSLFGVNPAAIPASIANNPFPNDLIYSNTNWYGEQQYSVFGEVSYNITPALKVSAGLRYSIGHESFHGVSGAYYTLDSPTNFAYSTNNYGSTPKFAVTYDIDQNNTVYGNVSKGFRFGAYNQPLPGNCNGDIANVGLSSTPPGFNPDSLWSYEAGTKSRFLDNRVSVDAAVYYIEWSDVQQRVYLPTCGFDFTTNVGNAESIGTEISITGRVSKELTLGLSGGYTHATLTSVNPGLNFTVGEKLTGTPNFTLIGTADYHTSITDDIAVFARGDWEWIGPSHGDLLTTDPNYSNPPYNVMNASFGADIDDWEIGVFFKNLLNQSKTIQVPSLLSANQGYTVRPMTVGLALSKSF